MRRLFLLFFIVLSFAAQVSATEQKEAPAENDSTAVADTLVNKALADSAYLQKHFLEASEIYQAKIDEILAEGKTPAADLFYNLGNAEYRLIHFPQAILNYLRALRIDPGHEDARYNVALVRTRIADRFAKPSEMFFISWFKDWVSTRSTEHWVMWSMIWLVALFAVLALYYIPRRIWIRKIGFFGALASIIAFAVATIFAAVQRYAYYHNDEAVVTADEIQLYGSPTNSSKKVRMLHEGTTVSLLDSHTKGWQQVSLPDGVEGWIPDSGVERVVK